MKLIEPETGLRIVNIAPASSSPHDRVILLLDENTFMFSFMIIQTHQVIPAENPWPMAWRIDLKKSWVDKYQGKKWPQNSHIENILQGLC